MCYPGRTSPGKAEVLVSHKSVILFCAKALSPQEISRKSVLEVGSANINGGCRELCLHWQPTQYVGIDIAPGVGVDRVCAAEDVRAAFAAESFDLVLSTEVLEHVRDWRQAIDGMKHVLRPNGLLVLTTRSFGMPYHGYPEDYWRFELSDMKAIFSEMDILALERDPEMPGVFVKARKRPSAKPVSLEDLRIFNILAGKRVGPGEAAGSAWRRQRLRFAAKCGNAVRLASEAVICGLTKP